MVIVLGIRICPFHVVMRFWMIPHGVFGLKFVLDPVSSGTRRRNTLRNHI